MDDRPATVKVKRDGPRGYHTINQADFDPSKHQLWEEPEFVDPYRVGVRRSEPLAGTGEGIQLGAGDPPAEPALTVGKGPRGKWYIKQGKELVAGPFDTEAEASRIAFPAPKVEPNP